MINRKISCNHMRRMIKYRCEAAGLCGMSSHSFRIGMTQDLANRDLSLLNIQKAGRWKSPAMPGYYIRGINLKKGAVAKYFDGKEEAVPGRGGRI